MSTKEGRKEVTVLLVDLVRTDQSIDSSTSKVDEIIIPGIKYCFLLLFFVHAILIALAEDTSFCLLRILLIPRIFRLFQLILLMLLLLS